jgi:CDP-diacylglycerol--glycerol-3-phosphate 3-phosphatidyltransferase
MLLKPLIPWLLVALRVLLCPTIILGAYRHWPALGLTAIICAASLSDVFDGIFARRWQCISMFGSIADSLADTIFYLGVAAALWILFPATLRANRQLFAILIFVEAFRYVFDFWKFRKCASYHSYLARFWGTVMVAAVLSIFSLSGLSALSRIALIRVSILLGLLANLEGFVMSLILPRWQHDVHTIFRAINLRKRMAGTELLRSNGRLTNDAGY